MYYKRMVGEPGKGAEMDWQTRAAWSRIVYLVVLAFVLAIAKGFFDGMARHNPLLINPIPDFVPSTVITMLIPWSMVIALRLQVPVQSHPSGNLSYFLFHFKRPVQRSILKHSLFLALWGIIFVIHAPLFAFETMVSQLTRSDAR